MGAAGSVDGRVMLEAGTVDFEQFGRAQFGVVSTRTLARPGGAHALLSAPSLAHLAGGRDVDGELGIRRAVYPLAPSNSTDRMVMLMEALVEFLEAVEGNLQHREGPPDNRTPHTILERLPCRISDGGDAEHECYICLAAFEAGDKVRILPCQHEFHSSCVDRWLLDVHRTCPCCRLDICASAEGEGDKEAEDASDARTRRVSTRIASREMALQGMRRVTGIGGVDALETRWDRLEDATDRVTAAQRQAHSAQGGVAEVGEAPPMREDSAGLGRMDTTTARRALDDQADAGFSPRERAAQDHSAERGGTNAAPASNAAGTDSRSAAGSARTRGRAPMDAAAAPLRAQLASDLAASQSATRRTGVEEPVALRDPRQPGAREDSRQGAVASSDALPSPSASPAFVHSPSAPAAAAAAAAEAGAGAGGSIPASPFAPTQGQQSPAPAQGLASAAGPATSATTPSSSPSMRTRASRVGPRLARAPPPCTCRMVIVLESRVVMVWRECEAA